MIEWLDGKIVELTALVRAGFTLAAVVLVGWTYFKTRALTALLVSALAAGIFLFFVHNPGWWRDRVGDETVIESGAPPSVASGLALTADTDDAAAPAVGAVVVSPEKGDGA